MSCYASPEEWNRVHRTIHELMLRITGIKPKNEFHKAAIEELLKELNMLREDIHTFRKDERICWEEFWIRIESIKKRMKHLEQA
mgnify:CR=1 FL=1